MENTTVQKITPEIMDIRPVLTNLDIKSQLDIILFALTQDTRESIFNELNLLNADNELLPPNKQNNEIINLANERNQLEDLWNATIKHYTYLHSFNETLSLNKKNAKH